MVALAQPFTGTAKAGEPQRDFFDYLLELAFLEISPDTADRQELALMDQIEAELTEALTRALIDAPRITRHGTRESPHT